MQDVRSVFILLASLLFCTHHDLQFIDSSCRLCKPDFTQHGHSSYIEPILVNALEGICQGVNFFFILCLSVAIYCTNNNKRNLERVREK